MPNFRDIISKSIFILLFCLHAVNAFTSETYDHFFQLTADIQTTLQPSQPGITYNFEHYWVEKAKVDSLQSDFDCLLSHWMSVMAKSNQELEAMEMDITRIRTELAQLKKIQSIVTQMGVKNAKISRIPEGTESLITAVEENLQTMTTMLKEQERNAFTSEALNYHEFLKIFSRILARIFPSQYLASKWEIEHLRLEFDRITKITEKMEAKERETWRMRTELAAGSKLLAAMTEEIFFKITTTLEEQEEKVKDLKAFNTEKDAEISNLKHFLKDQTAQRKTELAVKETDIFSRMRTEIAQRGKEIETVNTAFGVKDRNLKH